MEVFHNLVREGGGEDLLVERQLMLQREGLLLVLSLIHIYRAAYDAAETAEEKLWFIDDKRIIEHMTTEQLARLAQLDDAIDEANSALESGIEYDSDTKMQLLQALSDAYAARAEFVISLATDDDLGYYGLVLQWAKDISGVTDCSYDCSDDLSALPEGIYYASACLLYTSWPLRPAARTA